MKKTAIILALAAGATTLTAAQLVEAIVIRVGDRIITRTQYAKRLHDGVAEIEQTAAPSEAATKKADLQKNLTNDLIAELLIKDRADRLGITISSITTLRSRCRYRLPQAPQRATYSSGAGLSLPALFSLASAESRPAAASNCSAAPQ